jgi:hypothetical protein
MIPPVPAGCRSWDSWCDQFQVRAGRACFVDEIAAAAMAVALGQPEPEPLTDAEQEIVSERNRKTPAEAGEQTSLYGVST